ncbi:MAG: NUDIX hydrolase [Paracoccaceae bacterium]
MGIPWWKVEEDETLDQAIIREIKEEINLEISKNCVAPLTFAVDQHGGSETILFYIFVESGRFYH